MELAVGLAARGHDAPMCCEMVELNQRITPAKRLVSPEDLGSPPFEGRSLAAKHQRDEGHDPDHGRFPRHLPVGHGQHLRKKSLAFSYVSMSVQPGAQKRFNVSLPQLKHVSFYHLVPIHSFLVDPCLDQPPVPRAVCRSKGPSPSGLGSW